MDPNTNNNDSKKRHHPDQASPSMNGAGNSSNNNHHPEQESIVSLFSANSEAFSAANSDTFSVDETSLLQDQGSISLLSVMSASEAGSILERHIADHPIETADDFHYIAELLRNYENEDDLKRVAELLRAKQSNSNPLKKGSPITAATATATSASASAAVPEPPVLFSSPPPTTNEAQHQQQSTKKKKAKKKRKKHKRETCNDEEDYNDESFSVSSSSSSSNDSLSSSSASVSSIDDDDDDDDDDESSTSSSSWSSSSSDKKPKKRKKQSKKERKKEKKRRKKDWERIRREVEREEARKREKRAVKKAAKKAKKEEKKRKKQEKAEKKKAKGKEDTDFPIASNLPPTSVQVVHKAGAPFGKGNASTKSLSTETSEVDSWAKSPDQKQHTVSGDEDDGPRETFHDEDEPPPQMPPEAFPYPDILKANNKHIVRLSLTPPTNEHLQTSASIVPETGINGGMAEDDESESSEGLLYPGLWAKNEGSSGLAEDDSDTDFDNDLEDSFAFAGDSFHNEGAAEEVYLPALPENGALQLETIPSGSTGMRHNSRSRNSEVSIQTALLGNDSTSMFSSKAGDSENLDDSWAQQPGLAVTQSNATGISGRQSSRTPTLPTIFSSVRSGPVAAQAGDSRVSDGRIDLFREYQEGLAPHSDGSASESTFDDERLDMAVKKFVSTQDVSDKIGEKAGPPGNNSTAYPPMAGNFHFARQVSADEARQAQPLPSSKLNASLILGRETFNPLLHTTLEMARQKSGTSTSTLSSSLLRPPSSRRMNSGIVSTKEIGQLHESMAHDGHGMLAASFNASMALPNTVAESNEEGMMQNPVQLPHDVMGDTAAGETIQAEFAVKPRLLCLHGWRSNAEITRLQLENLGLLDFFDPIFIEGPHISSKPADDAVNLLSQGPYYSWVNHVEHLSETNIDGEELKPERSGDVPQNSLKNMRRMRQSIANIAHLGHLRRSGRNGGKNHRQIATEELLLSLKAVMVHLLAESQYLDGYGVENEEIASIPCYDAVYGFSQGATLVTLLSYDFVRNMVLEELNLPPMQRLPWNFVISACAANTDMKELLAHHFEFEFSAQISLPSIHIIGLSDSRKGQSDSIMKQNYTPHQVLPIYLDSGHGIPAATRKLTYLLDEIINWFLLKIALPDVDVATVPLESGSKHVSMLHIMDEIDKIRGDQLEDYTTSKTDLDVGQLHLGKYAQTIINTVESSHINLIEMLEEADPRQIAFLAPEAKPLRYGSFLKFIRGDGDLRRAGAKEGFTVAYVAPFGVVSATAFITVASQCPAAPLDPGYNESDFLLAFEQLKPDLVITFDGVDSGLVHKVALGQGLRVAHATVQPGTCGLFRFESSANVTTPDIGSSLDPRSCLVNHGDNNGLILRTSGTTSTPKVVPLKLWAIVSNSRVIAKNLGLRKTDIALNAMPLFHIGGLSANLLSSLAAGASVILLPKFNAADFFDFLTSPEEPRPTWYSAVPTMHAAVHQFSEDVIFKTSLRFIRSGAAAMPHDLALKMEKTFDCPMILTYSMTEQMPISQPPRGYSIARNKPNSVGQPVCASMCIVDKNLRPVLFPDPAGGEDGASEPEQINGEVCCCGPMIIEGYVANSDANTNSFFRMGGMDWFRTGDMGHLDQDGFLFLTGRSKELIKRGGDQVSPYEVEDAVYKHDDVKTVVVFAIPDPIWGERVGAAIVLKDEIKHDQLEFKKALNKMLVNDGLQPFKVPEEVILVKEDDLPKTRSNKYIRIGLAEKLGLNSNSAREKLKGMRPVNYHEAAVGVKFFLAYAVTYVHIGNFDNRDLSDYAHDSGYKYGWENTRSWCWHNPIFFLVGGFLLAAGTHVPVTNLKDLANFYSLRIAGLHPMYLLSILFCTINFVARCNPSNYIPDFDRLREPLDGEYFVCQATPIEWSYAPTLIISILTYACTLQSWPMMIPFTWFLSYYTWFSSVYIFCIFVFPWIHQQYHAVRDDIRSVWKLNVFWLGMNYLYVGLISVLFAMNDAALQNYFAISAYLFPPGWVPCCALGVGCYYLFRHYRPNEMMNAWVWGTTTDVLSLLLLVGWLFYGLVPSETTPAFASDDKLIKRHWDPFLSRILAPVGFLWFWGLAVGTGFTSRLFSLPFVVEWLAPASYNMFLFHQPVTEWYYLATRGKWWAYPKEFFWFSPYPFPVQFWEFFIVTGIVVAFSVFMEAYANEFLVSNFSALLSCLFGGGVQRKKQDGESVVQVVQSIIKELTYAETDRDTGLTEAGLSSMTTIILVSEIKKVYKTLKLTVRDVINSDTVGELVDLIEGRMNESATRPELALGKRTGVVAPKTLKKMMLDDDSHDDDGGSIFLDEISHTHVHPSRASRMSFALNAGSRISVLTDNSQNNQSFTHQRPSDATSRNSGRSRRASFVLGSGSASVPRRRSIAVAINNSSSHNTSASRLSRPPNSSAASFLSRGVSLLPHASSHRMTDNSDNASLPSSAHNRRQTGHSTISTSNFARQMNGGVRPKRPSRYFTP